MSVMKLEPSAPFWSGITRIQRQAGESPEQFEASKERATFQVEGQQHTLTLDGKVDDIVLQGLRPYSTVDRLITDIRELKDKASVLRQACLSSEEDFSNVEVDLGSGSSWWVFPQKDSQTHKTYGYELLNGPGPQTIFVKLEENGVDVCVTSQDKTRELGHSMRAKIGDEGSCDPFLEGVSWRLAP